MRIEHLNKKDSHEIVKLWNESINEKFIYKKLDESSFLSTFFRESNEYTTISYKAVLNKEIIGFISGVLYPNRKTSYITMVLVKEEHRKKGIGTLLYKEFQKDIIKEKLIIKEDLLFTNPINLIWNIPFTDLHEHPNAPGVDLKGDGYLFFKSLGFRDFTYQNSYYRDIQSYEYAPDIVERLNKLKEENITADFYDINNHVGLEELMRDLKSSAWETEILNHVKEKGEDNTLLVALDGNLVIGFTGPIHKQVSGRGYFAGVGIHSKYRGRGIGTLLFTKLCMSFKEIDVLYSTLFTAKNNYARLIYEREDFKIVRSWANMRKEVKR